MHTTESVISDKALVGGMMPLLGRPLVWVSTMVLRCVLYGAPKSGRRKCERNNLKETVDAKWFIRIY
jgi:hypothetical protein